DKLIHLILLSGLVCFPGSLAENLALKGTATQSSTYPEWLAQYAIDGVRYGPDAYASPFCSATETSSESNPWWRLDLLDVYNISTVIITAHDDYLSQANGAEIRIGNSLVNNGNNNPICAVTPDPLPNNTVSYSCGVMEGRYVNVILSGRKAYLTLCEVEVYETAGHTISYSCHGMEGRYVNVVMTGRTSPLALCEVEVYGKCIDKKILFGRAGHRRRTFLRLKFSSSVDVAAERDKILHQVRKRVLKYKTKCNDLREK
ncbi:FBP32II precursor, partial [Triplophysa rosa]